MAIAAIFIGVKNNVRLTVATTVVNQNVEICADFFFAKRIDSTNDHIV